MKEATFSLAILAAVVAIRYVWFRVAARVGVARSAALAAETAVFSRAPLPRFDSADLRIEAEDLPLWTGSLPVSMACLIPSGTGGHSTGSGRPHPASLRGTLLRIASRLYPRAPANKRLRRSPLPGNAAGECLRFRLLPITCPA